MEFADNMRRFEFKNKLQAAIQTFIVSQLLSLEEKAILVDFFKEFDKDNDGVIST
jgi:Ca2+-binding EF-hand superfamily protein